MKRLDTGPGATLQTWLENLLALAALAIVAIVVYQIFARGLAMSIRWTEELARLICIWAIFLGMPVLMRQRGLIRIEYFFYHLPVSMQHWVLRFEYAVAVLLMIFLAGLTAYQVVETWDQTSAGLLWPMGIFTLPIALGALQALYFQFESRRKLLSLPSKASSEEEVARAAA
jgi:TRAP-type C4-dicarboxylate transport system permease small subunit